MMPALTIHLVAVLLAAAYFGLRVDRGLSVTGLTLGSLILVHGIPMTVYLTVTGPDTQIYEAALANVNREEGQSAPALAVAIMFVCFIGGCELANISLARLARKGRNAFTFQPPGELYRILVLGEIAELVTWIILISMLVVAISENQIGKVFQYFASGDEEIGKILMRREGGGTPYYLYNVVLASIAPFMVMAMISIRRSGDTLVRHKWLLGSLLFVVLLGKLGTLSKAPPVIFLLQLLLLYLLLRRRKLNLTSFALLISASFFLFLVMVHWTFPELDTQAVLQFLYYRVFDIPNEGLLEFFTAIPTSIPHGQGGGIFSFLRTVSNSEYIPMYFAVADVTRNSLDSTSNSMFIADAWAEFGWTGVVVFAVIAGSVVRAIDLMAFKRGESDLSACLVAGCSYGIFTMLSTSLTTALVTGGLALIPLVALFLQRNTRRTRSDARPSKIATSSPTNSADT
jgi:oligosaccharide repeat unit polymerase